jgi:WD40 repeat protein
MGGFWRSVRCEAEFSSQHSGPILTSLQTGYSPRVLIFSLQDNSSDLPLAILNEHTYGLRAVAFSPDQKYLASLGAPNDGFLYVWCFNQRTGAAKLHSSNKCTSFVKQMIWLGNSIITYVSPSARLLLKAANMIQRWHEARQDMASGG